MSALKKQTYLKGAAILVVANLMVKVIGAVFKIPLANILQEEGMALFSTAYNLYTMLFVIATAGLPVAISKMVSESLAKNNQSEVKRIFRIALSMLSFLGVLGMLILLVGAKPLAKSVGSPESTLAIIAIAPAVFFVAALSAFRGYFQGHSNMIPTAVSEVVEALGKLLVGLALAYFFMQSAQGGFSKAAAGAVLGVTGGAFAALAIMAVSYVVLNRKSVSVPLSADLKVRSRTEIFKTLLLLAIPITIGAAVTSLTNVIDMAMIRQRLQTISVSPEICEMLGNFYGLAENDIKIGEFLSTKASDVLYGAYTGFAIPLFNLPPTIVMALSLSIVPAISSAFALKNYSSIQMLTQSTLRITIMFSVPCAVGLSVLSTPILIALYNNARSYALLSVLAYAVITVCLVSVTTAILQATGHVMLPVKNMLIGGILKIITNYIFVAIPSVNIGGAPITTNICYLAIAILNICDIIKITKAKISITEFIIKPVISALVMGIAAVFSYNLAAGFLSVPKLSLAITFMDTATPITPLDAKVRFGVIAAMAVSIFVAVIVYAIMIFVTKSVKKDDVLMLPKGEKLAKILEKRHLLS
ncbi:MAG: polysaccharide biosynthesis protein [Clostridia bacterium]|nr:polysaccharide biosynthesis protein [Clostridia bacterium]